LQLLTSVTSQFVQIIFDIELFAFLVQLLLESTLQY